MFIEIVTKDFIIVHGYDEDGKEVSEDVKVPVPTKKIMAVSRIQSITDKYILTSSLQGRYIYWEYEGKYIDLFNQLKAASLLI
jgi:hypothetical protein